MPPCQRADALSLGVPQELCGAALQPMIAQLRRDMQHWKPRSITPAMLDEIRDEKRDDPVRVALMIVNRTVWYQRPLGTPRSPMVIALVHDLQAAPSAPLLHRSIAPLLCTPARLHACRVPARLDACTLAPGAQELADSHPVPDVEFVLNVDDYPFVKRRRRRASRREGGEERELARRPPLPLFSHYQTTAHADILCPGGSFREGRYDG